MQSVQSEVLLHPDLTLCIALLLRATCCYMLCDTTCSQCKILGETLSTTVQTLVAGAFVSYMPPTIFWLR